jgi:autotransporter-associated beta strand protein
MRLYIRRHAPMIRILSGSAPNQNRMIAMTSYLALDAASPASAERPLSALAMAVCIALGLSACGGGGGGSNVKTNPPPPVVDTSPMVVSTDLTVANGQTLARPVVLEAGADLDNRGAIGGAVDVAVEAKAPSVVANHAGGTIHGRDTAIRLDHGGEIHNDAGATIQATGTGGTDCGTNATCAIYVGPNDQAGTFQAHFWLENAGTIIGDVRMDPAGYNFVNLYAGSTIQGDLDLGSARGSTLELAGGAGTTQRYSQAVTGTTTMEGVLTKSGEGTWIIDRNWGHPSDITIVGGRLEIADGGPTDFSNPKDQFSPISIYLHEGELVFDRSDDVEFFAAIFGDGSLVKRGTGRLLLDGSLGYAGPTTVEGGELVSNSILPGDAVVNSAGTLDVYAIGGDLANAGRLVANANDTIVGGDYAQASGGTLAISLGSKLAVDGRAALAGGTLEVTGADDGYIADAHTEVLTAGGGLTGTFDRLVKDTGVVFTSSTIHYDANSAWLDTTGLDVTTAAAGDGIGYTASSMSSAERVQGAFEQLDDQLATGTPADASGEFLQAAGQFQQASSIEAAQASLRSLSGELHAASAAMTFRAIDAGNQALSDHLDGVRGGRAALGMWTQQLGSGGGMARSGFDGVGFQLDGWLVGNDFRVGRSGVVGFAFGQGQGLQQLQGGFDRDSSRRTEGMAYAGLAGDRWYAQGRLGFGQFRQDVSRALLLGDGAEGVWTRYGGRYQVAYGESGARYALGDLRIAPFASIEYARSERDAFAEEGAGGFGLRSDAQSQARWQASVGVRASRQWSFGRGRALDFGAHAQWFRASGSNLDAMDASFVGLQQWSPLLGIGLSRYGGLFGVGLDARLSSNASFKLSYDYERAQYDSAHGMTAGLDLAF